MFHVPEYSHCVSMRLSEVMNDIGVNEQMVLKRRQMSLLQESMQNICYRLQDMNFSTYYFGSRSESTTTRGLQSDRDILHSLDCINIIQDWSEWKPGILNYLMIQDETVTPGYCLLQMLRSDVPLPYSAAYVPNEHCVQSITHRILLKNTIIHNQQSLYKDGYSIRNGPSCRKQSEGFIDIDLVISFLCESWPKQARSWIHQQNLERWPSEKMKLYCINSGCFIVPVGSKDSDIEDVQWRVSTSLAERCLMFNLNITQLRCYILMKMILKTYIDPYFEDTISSFMCKTVLFYCIQNTCSNIWQENTLLFCLTCCLQCLYNFIRCRNCPHFIIPGNNLMRGKISDVVKPQLLQTMLHLIQTYGQVLLGIGIDYLGTRLQNKFNVMHDMTQYFPSSLGMSLLISGELTFNFARSLNGFFLILLDEISRQNIHTAHQTLQGFILHLTYMYVYDRNMFAKIGCSFLASFLCTTLGSVLAAYDIRTRHSISRQALDWFSLGLKFDISSSRLKLASVFYCAGDFKRAEYILQDIERCYNLTLVEPVCCCSLKTIKTNGPLKSNLCFFLHSHYFKTQEAVKHLTSFCLRFLPCEMNCVPQELLYEMCRSTEEDRHFRTVCDFWMELAVVDSLPFLYFLLYKTYGHLRKQREQQHALAKFVWCIDNESNLGHPETALNLLGQCFEQENRPINAIKCYLVSLNLHGRNNAAKFHIRRVSGNVQNLA